MAERKLRPYFQADSVRVLTEQPLRKILHDFKSSGRMINWDVELREFDISYHPQPSVKGQALADFILECTIPDRPIERTKTNDKKTQPKNPTQTLGSEELDIEYWNMYFDGASNKLGNRAGIILTSPHGFTIQYALALDFDSRNNEAEYEAMLAGLSLAQSVDVKNIRIYSDSQSVANQVTGDYTA
ncbi:uncharacterized protein [Rutidosis leptorrhynchoides]|uniref:uncharacterized protein n=1 Tax=Rutidosis leptorrhynchoides TaxID=125765 RepID=UPI003A9A2F75